MKQRQRYTAEFKAQIVELANAGRSVSDLSREFELTTRIINKWKQAAYPSHPLVRSVVQGAEGDMDEAQELRMLRKKVAELEMVNDILKKAAIILGTSTPTKLGK